MGILILTNRRTSNKKKQRRKMTTLTLTFAALVLLSAVNTNQLLLGDEEAQSRALTQTRRNLQNAGAVARCISDTTLTVTKTQFENRMKTAGMGSKHYDSLWCSL